MSTSAARPGGRDWLRAAARPRMLLLLALVVVLGLLFVRLGFWQYERSGIRGEQEAEIQREELQAADAVPVDEVLAPQSAFEAEHFGRRVEMHGTFEADKQLLVPDRGVDGEEAVLVVTAFRVDGGPHDGARIPVLRGWLPSSDVFSSRLEAGEQDLGPVAPPPPPGTMSIVGMLAAAEAVDSRDLPGELIGSISTAQLVNVWGTPMYGGYLVLEEPAQGDGLRPAPSPVEELDAEPNLQSLMYAIEWWAFALFAAAFWVKVLYDDVRDLRRRRAPRAAPAEPAS